MNPDASQGFFCDDLTGKGDSSASDIVDSDSTTPIATPLAC